ncbi:hypothetical protein G6F57_023678 [Rhizopus arrhizus]|nr:hypothetical protein G6F57_023678 [Rhizopus arrhizus]
MRARAGPGLAAARDLTCGIIRACATLRAAPVPRHVAAHGTEPAAARDSRADNPAGCRCPDRVAVADSPVHRRRFPAGDPTRSGTNRN